MSWTTGIRTQRLIRRNNKRGNARFHWEHVAKTKHGRLMHGSQGPAIAYGREKALVSVQQTCSSWTYSAEGGTTKAASTLSPLHPLRGTGVRTGGPVAQLQKVLPKKGTRGCNRNSIILKMVVKAQLCSGGEEHGETEAGPSSGPALSRVDPPSWKAPVVRAIWPFSQTLKEHPQRDVLKPLLVQAATYLAEQRLFNQQAAPPKTPRPVAPSGAEHCS
ncbi:hypothetical protein GOODEAATRI_027648 [Goodea atripinnis]|uniref:Uncharacterized protein n=1 Tax=Goodea atripinnis TaxID=208336 RepID=A0ABV0N5S3_9TELE